MPKCVTNGNTNSLPYNGEYICGEGWPQQTPIGKMMIERKYLYYICVSVYIIFKIIIYNLEEFKYYYNKANNTNLSYSCMDGR